jgi:hypothetical protein
MSSCLLCGDCGGSPESGVGVSLLGRIKTSQVLLRKVLKYWALPQDAKPSEEEFEAILTHWQNKSYCPSCIQILEEIETNCNKIVGLELLIQSQVEELGKNLTTNESNKADDDEDGDDVLVEKEDQKGRGAWNKIKELVAESNECKILKID